MLRFAPILPSLAIIAGCAAPGPEISAHDGWARETGRSEIAVAYLTIDNKGAADQLTDVRSEIGEATLHETTTDGGIMRMRPIAAGEGLVVPSNGKLMLAPGGAHVMLTKLKRPLKAGDRFSLTLLFDRSRPERVVITVKPATESRMVHQQ